MRIKKIFQKTEFLLSANSFADLPKGTHKEVAFAGRSNAGKSSALNLITSQNSLARISKTPGRTQLINYFKVLDDRFLVDLPGYGYAKVPEKMRDHWKLILQEYFDKRTNLVGLIMLMDVRHPLTPLDCQMLDWCHARNLPTHILLTKADKLKRGAQVSSLQSVRNYLKNMNNMNNMNDGSRFDVTVQLFSAISSEVYSDKTYKTDKTDKTDKTRNTANNSLLEAWEKLDNWLFDVGNEK